MENRSESSRFEILKEIFKFNSFSNILGVGSFDDAAVIEINKDTSLIIASDFVRGSGFSMFRYGLMNYEDIGYYLIIANISDMAAMGCKPVGLTNVFRYTHELTNNEFKAVLEGMKKACVKYDTEIVGGDIGSYQSNVLAATAFGFMAKDKVLLRSGAKKGDLLCLVGDIGLPFTALLYFEKAKKEGAKLKSDEEKILQESWCKPTAEVDCGVLLSDNRLANSCQDVSDGLKASIEQISKASKLSFEIYEDSLPINEITKKVATFLDVCPTAMALSASVDFSLLFTIPPEKLEKTRQILSSNDIALFVIGKEKEHNENVIIDSNSEIRPIPGLKWDHKSGSVSEQFLKGMSK